MPFSSAFSYYGSKSKLAHLYPAPTGSLIIEPFAGSAAYALRHSPEHEVWINELDPTTFSIWKFLTRPDALDWVRRVVPAQVQTGQKVSTIIFDAHEHSHDPIPEGLVNLLRAEAHMGTAGTRANYDVITSLSATCWNRRLRRRLEWVIPRIRNWTVTNLDYRALPLGEEHWTWFVDPPYQGAPGRAYRQNDIDYHELGEWCVDRQGQVIVAENEGATWLRFEHLSIHRRGFNTVHRKTSVPEVMWHRPSLDPTL